MLRLITRCTSPKPLRHLRLMTTLPSAPAAALDQDDARRECERQIWNMKLCFDGESIIAPDLRPLGSQLSQYFDLNTVQSQSMEAVLQHFVPDLRPWLPTSTSSGSPRRRRWRAERRRWSVRTVSTFVHYGAASRNCWLKTFLRSGVASLTAEQHDFLQSATIRMGSYFAGAASSQCPPLKESRTALVPSSFRLLANPCCMKCTHS